MNNEEIQKIINDIAFAMEVTPPGFYIGKAMAYNPLVNQIEIDKKILDNDKYLLGSIAHEMVHFYNNDNGLCLKKFDNILKESRADIDGFYFLNKAYPSITKKEYVYFLEQQYEEHLKAGFTRNKCIKAGYFPCDKRVEIVNKFNKFTNETYDYLLKEYKKLTQNKNKSIKR